MLERPLGPIAGMGLDEDDAHILSLLLHPSAQDLLDLRSLLSPDEQVRAERFHYERDRSHYIARRGCLRLILAAYLEVSPLQIQYAVGAYEKPRLAAPLSASRLRFSVSHSGDRALIAIARDRAIGVDLEQVKPISELEALADSVFSERERSLFRALREPGRTGAFFKVWTQKEAYLKGRGLGLNQHPSEIDVALLPDEKASLLGDRRDVDAPRSWSLVGWKPGPGYVAALAIHGSDCRIVGIHESHRSLAKEDFAATA